MTAPIIHGGGITEAARIWGGEPGDWLDLSTGINPNPVALPDMPASVWHRLPDAHLVNRAREAARIFYGSGHSLPLPVPGTQAFIQHLPLLVPADRPVAILSPTYGEYEHRFRAAGFPVVPVSEPDDMPAEAGTLVIANPNNPTGRVFDAATLLMLADRMVARGGVLVVDEAFGDTRPELSVAAEAGQHPGLIVSRSFGKYFGLAGMRLGFVIAVPAVLDRLTAAMGPWPVSGPALHVAAKLMARERMAINAAIAERRAALGEILTNAGLAIRGGTDLFVLVETPGAHRLHDRLAQLRILVRRFAYAPNWLRFGLAADPVAERRLAEALR